MRTEGELYRLDLERLTAKLGMQQHVIFYNRFVELDELNEFIGAADIYVTPYLNQAQITSGTLCYAFGCGKAVVSTPYWHAEELLADGRGVLVPFRDSGSIASAVNGLLQDEARLGAMCERAYLLGREMIWAHIARHYFSHFARHVPITGITTDVGSPSRPWPNSRWNSPSSRWTTSSGSRIRPASSSMPSTRCPATPRGTAPTTTRELSS